MLHMEVVGWSATSVHGLPVSVPGTPPTAKVDVPIGDPLFGVGLVSVTVAVHEKD